LKGLRRPPFSLSKSGNKTLPQTTEFIDSTSSVTTVNAIHRNRSRPTYVPTTSPVPIHASSPRSDTIRRRYGRPPTNNNSGERKQYTPIHMRSTTEAASSTVPKTRTAKPLFRRRFGYTSTTTKLPKSSNAKSIVNTDQELEPSLVEKKFVSTRYNHNSDIFSDGVAEAITTISKAPLPYSGSTTIRNVKITTPGSSYLIDKSDFSIATRSDILATSSKRVNEQRANDQRANDQREISTITLSPIYRDSPGYRPVPIQNYERPGRLLKQRPQEFRNNALKVHAVKEIPKQSFRSVDEYDYYDEGDVRIVGKANSKVKVVLHDAGIIECLDQGNFPHPLSCRKFISCAKMETGGVVGWEYTCPKGLSYDPVGGICNWAAGLGCKEG